MVYYILVKVIIDVQDLVEVIINLFVHQQKVLKFIVRDQDLLFTSKFLFSYTIFQRLKKSY